MTKDIHTSPHLQSGHKGEGDAEKNPGVDSQPRTRGESASNNRGKRAPRSGSGVVVGSGAGAGGGAAEDYDTDSQAGSGKVHSQAEPKPGVGNDAPVGGGR